MERPTKAEILLDVQNNGPIRMQDIITLPSLAEPLEDSCFSSCLENLKELEAEGNVKRSAQASGVVDTWEAI